MSDFFDYQEEYVSQLLQEGYVQQSAELAGVGVTTQSPLPFDSPELPVVGSATFDAWYNSAGLTNPATNTQVARLALSGCDEAVAYQLSPPTSSISEPAQSIFEVFTSNVGCFDPFEQAATPPATGLHYFRHEPADQAVETGPTNPLYIDQAELQEESVAKIPSDYSRYANHTDSTAQFVLNDNYSHVTASMARPENQPKAPRKPDENLKDQENDDAIRNIGGLFMCDHRGCKRKQPFKRQFELERHKLTHSNNKLDCPVEECSRKGSNGVRRVDKLKDHVRRHHSVEDRLPCPAQGCSVENMTMDLLREHMARHARGGSSLGWPGLCAKTYRICPLEGCRKGFRNPSKLQEHLIQHEVRDRMAQRTAVLDAGYHPETVQIICPCCKVESHDHQSFEKHFSDSHVLVDAFHAQQWIDACRNRGLLVKAFQDGNFAETTIDVPKGIKVDCPVCDFWRLDSWFPVQFKAKHHRKLFRCTDEIRENREAILRLLPDFGSHTVFDDLQPRR